MGISPLSLAQGVQGELLIHPRECRNLLVFCSFVFSYHATTLIPSSPIMVVASAVSIGSLWEPKRGERTLPLLYSFVSKRVEPIPIAFLSLASLHLALDADTVSK